MIPRANLKEIMLWLLRRRRRFRIAGHSMEPVLHKGDEVLVKSIYKPLSTTVPSVPSEPSVPSGSSGSSKKRAHLCDRTNVRAGNRLREEVIPGNLVVAKHSEYPEFLVVKQWDGKGLKSLCHQECAPDYSRIFGKVTSML